MFDSMDASLGRNDLTYGGRQRGRARPRVPLDEFTAAGAIVFISESLGWNR